MDSSEGPACKHNPMNDDETRLGVVSAALNSFWCSRGGDLPFCPPSRFLPAAKAKKPSSTTLWATRASRPPDQLGRTEPTSVGATATGPAPAPAPRRAALRDRYRHSLSRARARSAATTDHAAAKRCHSSAGWGGRAWRMGIASVGSFLSFAGLSELSFSQRYVRKGVT